MQDPTLPALVQHATETLFLNAAVTTAPLMSPILSLSRGAIGTDSESWGAALFMGVAVAGGETVTILAQVRVNTADTDTTRWVTVETFTFAASKQEAVPLTNPYALQMRLVATSTGAGGSVVTVYAVAGQDSGLLDQTGGIRQRILSRRTITTFPDIGTGVALTQGAIGGQATLWGAGFFIFPTLGGGDTLTATVQIRAAGNPAPWIDWVSKAITEPEILRSTMPHATECRLLLQATGAPSCVVDTVVGEYSTTLGDSSSSSPVGPPAAAGSFAEQKVFQIDPLNGDNATAQRDVRSLAFKDIDAALAALAANPSWLADQNVFILSPGIYVFTNTKTIPATLTGSLVIRGETATSVQIRRNNDLPLFAYAPAGLGSLALEDMTFTGTSPAHASPYVTMAGGIATNIILDSLLFLPTGGTPPVAFIQGSAGFIRNLGLLGNTGPLILEGSTTAIINCAELSLDASLGSSVTVETSFLDHVDYASPGSLETAGNAAMRSLDIVATGGVATVNLYGQVETVASVTVPNGLAFPTSKIRFMGQHAGIDVVGAAVAAIGDDPFVVEANYGTPSRAGANPVYHTTENAVIQLANANAKRVDFGATAPTVAGSNYGMLRSEFGHGDVATYPTLALAAGGGSVAIAIDPPLPQQTNGNPATPPGYHVFASFSDAAGPDWWISGQATTGYTFNWAAYAGGATAYVKAELDASNVP